MAEKQQQEKAEKAETRSFSMAINIDCEGCHRKVHKALQKIQGLQEVSIDPSQNKVSVKGTVEPEKVMKKLARNTGKQVQLLKQREKLNDMKNQQCNIKEKANSDEEDTIVMDQHEYNYNYSPFTREEVASDGDNYTSSFFYSHNSFLLYEEPESTPLCIIM